MSDKQWALITGASSGIGAAFAKALAARGMDLVVAGRRQEELGAVASDIRKRYGVEVEVVIGDLSQADDLDVLVSRLRERQPDWLVNNAGFGSGGQFPDLDVQWHLDMLRVHAEATIRLTHAALPAMLKRKSGTIINVSSILGVMRSIGSPMYGGTKAFLTSFSTGLARDLYGSGIRVQALCPGLTKSDFHSRPALKNYRPGRRARFMWKTSEEVVKRSIKAVEHGKLIYIPALVDRLIVVVSGNILVRPVFRFVDRRRRALKASAGTLQSSE